VFIFAVLRNWSPFFRLGGRCGVPSLQIIYALLDPFLRDGCPLRDLMRSTPSASRPVTFFPLRDGECLFEAVFPWKVITFSVFLFPGAMVPFFSRGAKALILFPTQEDGDSSPHFFCASLELLFPPLDGPPSFAFFLLLRTMKKTFP